MTGLRSPLAAHELPENPVVEMFLQPQADRLLVLIRVPTAVLADARLPRLASGGLDVASLEEPLRVVGTDIADNLEFRQGASTLARPEIRGVVSGPTDRSFATLSDAISRFRASAVGTDGLAADSEALVDFELVYAVSAGAGSFSARLNAFNAPGRPVRTVARFIGASSSQTVVVAGRVERVVFDPDWAEVVRQFIARSLQVLLGGGSYLLLLMCLVLPGRDGRTTAALIASTGAVLLATTILSSRLALPPEALAVAQIVAGSIVVMTAMTNVVNARVRWVRPLAVGFGALYGVVLAGQIAEGHAGRHAVLAASTFLVVIVSGITWIATVLWLIRRWLDGRGVPGKVLTIGVSALIAHTAIHGLLDGGQVLGPGLDRVLMFVALGWVGATIAVGVFEALTRRVPAVNGPRASSAAGTQ